MMPIVAMTAVSASSSGTPGSDERTESDQQDDQGDRQRCDQGLAEVLLDDVVDLLVGAGVAELAEGEARVRLLHGVDGPNGRLDPVRDLSVVAGDLKAEQRRVSVARDLVRVRRGQRALEVLGVGQRGKPPLHVDRHRAERGVAGGRPGALDQHHLLGVLRSGIRDRLSRLARTPRPRSGCAPGSWSRLRCRSSAQSTTNASHPQMAVLRCWALQTPAREASPRGVMPAVRSSRPGRDADMPTSMS